MCDMVQTYAKNKTYAYVIIVYSKQKHIRAKHISKLILLQLGNSIDLFMSY